MANMATFLRQKNDPWKDRYCVFRIETWNQLGHLIKFYENNNKKIREISIGVGRADLMAFLRTVVISQEVRIQYFNSPSFWLSMKYNKRLFCSYADHTSMSSYIL